MVVFCFGMKKMFEDQPTTNDGIITKVDLNGGNNTKKSSIEVDSTGIVMEEPITQSLSSTDTCCCICLEEFRVGERICQSYACSHVFHFDGCMLEWLMRHDECPICRRDYLFHPNEQRGCQSICWIAPYVGPVSPSLLPPSTTSYYPEGTPPQLPNERDHDDAIVGSMIHRRRITEGFAVSSLFGFDDLPPWL
jgi:hypothetical protein